MNIEQIDIDNFSGLEKLDDAAAELQNGGVARFVAFDDDRGGVRSPEIEITRNGKNFNLADISQRIGLNINNTIDRFVVRGTEVNKRYQVLLFNRADQTRTPVRFEFSGNGKNQSFSLGNFRNKTSSISVKQIS